METCFRWVRMGDSRGLPSISTPSDPLLSHPARGISFPSSNEAPFRTLFTEIYRGNMKNLLLLLQYHHCSLQLPLQRRLRLLPFHATKNRKASKNNQSKPTLCRQHQVT